MASARYGPGGDPARTLSVVQLWLLNVAVGLSQAEVARRTKNHRSTVLRQVASCEDWTDDPFYGPRLEALARRFDDDAEAVMRDLASHPLMREILRGPMEAKAHGASN